MCNETKPKKTNSCTIAQVNKRVEKVVCQNIGKPQLLYIVLELPGQLQLASHSTVNSPRQIRYQAAVERRRVHVAHICGQQQRGLRLREEARLAGRHHGLLHVSVEVRIFQLHVSEIVNNRFETPFC